MVFLLIDRTFCQLGIRVFPRDEYSGGSPGGYRLRESAVFGGGKRRITAQDFAGGKIDAVFGGTELRIPETWSAVVQGQGVFGGFADSTRQPDPLRTPNPKRLFVKGSAVFGGVEVKN